MAATSNMENIENTNSNSSTDVNDVNDVNELNLIYYARSNIVHRECDSIIITDTNSKIIRILTPNKSTKNKSKYELLKDNIECNGNIECNDNIECNGNDNIECNENIIHSINDNIYELEKCCCSKFPYHIQKNTDVDELLEYISNIYRSGNPSAWAGHTMGFSADEDYELTGYYIDAETEKYYWGWVSTHQTVNLPRPRMTKFHESKNSNNIIHVLLEDDEDGNGLKISYNGQFAYSKRNMTDEIYDRLWDLLCLTPRS